MSILELIVRILPILAAEIDLLAWLHQRDLLE